MSALEQEIIEKFRRLDKAAQQRVRRQIEQEGETQPTGAGAPETLSLHEWLVWAQGFGAYVHEKYGERGFTSVDLLNEAREERLDDLMGGR